MPSRDVNFLQSPAQNGPGILFHLNLPFVSLMAFLLLSISSILLKYNNVQICSIDATAGISTRYRANRYVKS